MVCGICVSAHSTGGSGNVDSGSGNVVSGSGIPTLDGFGPYGDGDHTIHERANKSSFVKRINQVSEILIAFNGVTDLSCNRVA